MVFDPTSDGAMVVPPETVPLIGAALADFPVGHAYHLGERDPKPTALLGAWRTVLSTYDGFRAARAFWKQVKGQDAELLLELEPDEQTDAVAAFEAVREPLFAVFREQDAPFPIVLALPSPDPDHPLNHHRALVQPFWSRDAEKA